MHNKHNTHEKLKLKDEEQLLETLHTNFCTYIPTTPMCTYTYNTYTHNEEAEL